MGGLEYKQESSRVGRVLSSFFCVSLLAEDRMVLMRCWKMSLKKVSCNCHFDVHFDVPVGWELQGGTGGELWFMEAVSLCKVLWKITQGWHDWLFKGNFLSSKCIE